MEANGIRAMAVRMLAARDEGDWARRGIEASCAFIMASAGRYGCSPFAAAACAAMWLRMRRGTPWLRQYWARRMQKAQ